MSYQIFLTLLTDHQKQGNKSKFSDGTMVDPPNKKKKKKKEKDSVDHDRKTSYWYPDHKLPIVFDGIYVLHMTVKWHGKWLEKKK